MKIDIVLLSQDARSREIFYQSRTALIPASIRKELEEKCPGINFSFRTFDPNRGVSLLSEYLIKKCIGNGVIVLVHGQPLSQQLPDFLKTSCFVHTFDHYAKATQKNHLSSILVKSIRSYVSILMLFSDRNNKAMLSLPFKNFKNSNLSKIRKQFISAESDLNTIKSELKSLKKCRRPRRNSNSPKKLIFSNDSYFFEYAQEKHARVETGFPHNNACILTGKFRFGVKLESDQHYNMFKEKNDGTTVSGQFTNCHDLLETPKRTTHINIFSNDFLA